MQFNKNDVICREDLGLPEGALVCDRYNAAGGLLAHRLGGGFQLTIPAADLARFRLIPEGEKEAVVFQPGRFALADCDEAFDGWTNGRLWNGWEMPRFEFAVCGEILKVLGDERAGYGGRRDAFATLNQDGVEEVWAAESITLADGSRMKVYPLGAGAWMWERMPESEARRIEI